MGRLNKQAKIWKQHYGSIPKDNNGRSYDIHHIDGDPNNNDISNLKAVSIQEHYEIHRDQGDYGAAFMIAKRMKVKPSDISETARLGTLQRVKAGTHNFQDPNFPRSLDHNKGMVVALDTRTNRTVRVTKEEFDNSEYLVGSNTGRKQKNIHNNRGWNIGKTWKQKEKRSNVVTCPHCNKSGDASGLIRWHFERCKFKNESG